MKSAIISKNRNDVNRVFPQYMRDKLSPKFDLLEENITRNNLNKHKEYLSKVEYLFSTWGMESYSKEEIKEYFPNLKGIFYAAGSVQHFAQPFIEMGINVYSAWQANAVPVAEYVYAQIILANKGFYVANKYTLRRNKAIKYAENHGGNYHSTIGIIGCGTIGSLVCEKLKSHNFEVLVYDPYISEEKCRNLKVKAVSSLEEIFSKCDVISNHLPNKDSLVKVLDKKLFKLMKNYSTFINTGRGRQVDERGLLSALKNKTITAVLDVTFPEPSVNPRIIFKKNIILTPHIAGSIGREVERMADYMIEESFRVLDNQTPLYNVSLEMLTTMA